MKAHIFTFISFLSLFSCKQDKSETLHIPHKVAMQTTSLSNLTSGLSFKNQTLFYNLKKFDGVLFELYKNGDTLSSIEYSKGLQDGISQKWYSNKQLMEKRQFLQGRKNGQQTAFFENGKKKFEFVAQNDVYEGELKEWNFNGDLIHLATYKNGQEAGTQKMWYDNGKIRANYVIKNGKRYGLLGTKNCKNVSDSIFVIK